MKVEKEDIPHTPSHLRICSILHARIMYVLPLDEVRLREILKLLRCKMGSSGRKEIYFSEFIFYTRLNGGEEDKRCKVFEFDVISRTCKWIN